MCATAHFQTMYAASRAPSGYGEAWNCFALHHFHAGRVTGCYAVTFLNGLGLSLLGGLMPLWFLTGVFSLRLFQC